MVKLIFALAPGYRGPTLIRGRQLDGLGQVGFLTAGTASSPQGVAEFPSADFISRDVGSPEGQWIDVGLLATFNRPGCYALQLDMPSSTIVGIFRAAP